MELNNRELASLVWIAAAIIFGFLKSDIRRALLGVLHSALSPALLIPALLMAGYSVLLTRLGSVVGLWNDDLLKETVVWFLGSALIRFFNINHAVEDGFFGRKALQVLGATTLVQFFLNLFVLGFFLELALQPILFLVVGVEVYAKTRDELQPAAKLARRLLAWFGWGMSIYAAYQLATNWRSVFTLDRLLEFDLPIWMTLGLLPFIYILSFYVAYDHALRHITIALRDEPRARRRVKLALLTSVFGRRNLSRVNFTWARRAVRGDNFSSARRSLKDSLRGAES